MGPTFTVMSVTWSGGTAIIGGYNALSWTGTGSYTDGLTDFVFNLTTDLKQTLHAGDPYGAVNNTTSYGPTFGGGSSLYVPGDLTSGFDNNTDYGTSGLNLFGQAFTSITINELETFTISEGSADLPEPASGALLGIGLAALGWYRRRTRSV